jgi:acetyl esterase/lipase
MATVEPVLPEAMEVIRTADQPYAGDRLLDVYAPAVGGDWPVVVVLHAGGLTKSGISSLARAVAGQGAIAFVPTYTSNEPSPDAIARGAIARGAEEAACAVRYARAMAAEYGGDARRIVAVGHSGGGAFAVLVALAGDEFVGDCAVSEGSGSVDGVVGLDGAYDLMRYIQPWILEKATVEEWLAISPYAWIDRQPTRPEVAFRLFAGLETELVQDGQAMRDALLAAGYQAEFTRIPGVDHMGMSGVWPQTLQAILEMARGN